jgi:hypothetical protein
VIKAINEGTKTDDANNQTITENWAKPISELTNI